MFQKKVCFLIVALCGSLMIGAGCNKSGRVEADVSGKVTINGESIPQGTIEFEKPDGSGVGGGNIVDGTYSAKAPIGEVRVRISGYKVDGQVVADPGLDDRMIDKLVSIVPEKFWSKSELTATIKSGSNSNVDFELKSDEKE